MTDELKVYLDHLIPRESLRYQRPRGQMVPVDSRKEPLSISSLQNSNRVKLLRKPDFQRETWAWTPEDCVSLLDSIVNEQVVPSIIMWTSPENGLDYILDGAHRVSVVLAWLLDDWGDNLPREMYRDDEHERLVKAAANQVRNLIRIQIGTIDDYIQSEAQMDLAIREGKSPQKDLPSVVFKRGYFYQSLLKGHVHFHVLWVAGDYEMAALSFLKINGSGRQLSDWERELVTNRNSSFARIVMSVASITSAKNYWPTEFPDIPDSQMLEQRVQFITQGIDVMYEALFKPSYREIQSLRQPLLVAPGPHQRPYYLAEFLTVILGGRGQPAETKKLIERDRDANVQQIVNGGWELVQETLNVLTHLVGERNKPESLAIVPALYLYTESGRYVRSLLYGLTYWLFAGNDRDLLERKRIFSAYRGAFERVLIDKKDDLVTGLSRKTGSGPDITSQTANYFNGLLGLVVYHKGDISSNSFSKDYVEFSKEIVNKRLRPVAAETEQSRGRLFTERQRSTIVLRELLSNPIRCGICTGILDPTMAVQLDHVVPYSQGGPTSVDNGRLAHPFCNNQREYIEQIQNGTTQVAIPSFVEPNLTQSATQMTFFDDPAFNP